MLYVFFVVSCHTRLPQFTR